MSKCEIDVDKYCNDDSFGLSLNFPPKSLSAGHKARGQMTGGEGGGAAMFNSTGNEEKRKAM